MTKVISNVFPLYAFRAFSRLYFHLPILLPVAFLAASEDMVKAGLVIAAYSLAVAITSLLKLPQKINARMRPISLVTISEVGKATALIAIGINQDLPTMILAQIVIGVCFALGAGADGSLPFRYLTGDQRKKGISSLQATMFAAVIIAAICSGFLLSIDKSLPFYFAAASAIIGVCFLRLLKELSTASSEEKPHTAKDDTEIKQPAVVWWKAYYLVTRISSMSVYVMLVPAACMAFGLSLEFFGVVLSGFGIGGFLAARYGTVIAGKAGFTTVALISVLSTAVAICAGVGGVLRPELLFVTVAFMGLAGGMVRPCTVGGLEGLGVSSRGQGSIVANLEQLGGLLTAPFVMGMAIALGGGVLPRVLFLVCGSVVGVLGLGLLLLKGRSK